jgi:hypothetical protein
MKFGITYAYYALLIFVIYSSEKFYYYFSDDMILESLGRVILYLHVLCRLRHWFRKLSLKNPEHKSFESFTSKKKRMCDLIFLNLRKPKNMLILYRARIYEYIFSGQPST